jgi:hypothetical protein
MRRRTLLAAALAFALVGCGGGTNEPPRGPVKGRVTLGGKPVANATVTFESAAAGVAQTAPTDDDGRYEFTAYNAQGLPAGSYKVGVTAGRFMQPGEEVPRFDPSVKPGTPLPKGPSTLPPAKYAKPATSGLTAEVKAGENPPFDFELKP